MFVSQLFRYGRPCVKLQKRFLLKVRYFDSKSEWKFYLLYIGSTILLETSRGLINFATMMWIACYTPEKASTNNSIRFLVTPSPKAEAAILMKYID